MAGKKTGKRLLTWVLVLVMALSLLPLNALAAEDSNAGEKSSGIEFSKEVSKQPDADKNYTITMEAWATGTTTPTESVKPMDIVLVLDVSGSMDEGFTETTYTEYSSETTNSEFWNVKDNLYFKTNDSSYQKVTLERGATDFTYTAVSPTYNDIRYGEYYVKSNEAADAKRVTIKWYNRGFNSGYYLTIDDQRAGDPIRSWEWNKKAVAEDYTFYEKTASSYTYTYTYMDDNGDRQSISSVGNDQTINWTLYSRSEVSSTKMSALQSAVNSFIESVGNSSKDHRIAIVKFASDDSNEVGNDFTFWYGYNCSQIVMELTATDKNGVTQLKNVVNDLSPAGATRSDYGMKHAKDIINASKAADTDDQRGRVVIMFTDGNPTDHRNFNVTVANGAISAAKEIKNAGAKIYTIGVFGEDPGDPINKYMNRVSSNCPNAFNMSEGGAGADADENAGYYSTAASADDLSRIFSSISGEISEATNKALDGKTEVNDVVSDYFDLATNNVNSIKVYTADRTADGGWADKQLVTDPSVTVALSGKTIKVSGYNYAANYVTDNPKSDSTYGQKLIIEITVKPNSTGCNSAEIPTNNGDATVTLDNTAIASKEPPTVDGYSVTYAIGDNASWPSNNSNGPATLYYPQKADVPVTDIEPTREGFKFTGWTPSTDNDAVVAPAISEGKFTMPAANVTLTAQWREIEAAELSVEKTVTKVGETTVAAGNNTIPTAYPGDEIEWTITVTNRGNAEGNFTLKETLSDITVKDAAGSPVTLSNNEWRGTVPANDSVIYTVTYTVKASDVTDNGLVNTVTMNGDGEESATVPTAQKYTVTGTIDNGGTVTNSPQKVKYDEKSAEMTFTPADGYKIISVTVNGTAVSGLTLNSNGSYTYPALDNVTQDIAVSVKTDKRTDLSYTVNYVDKNTGSEIHQSVVKGDKTFGDKVTGASEKVNIANYTYVEATPDPLTISTDATKNVITLYYTKDAPTPGTFDFNGVVSGDNKVTPAITKTVKGNVGRNFKGTFEVTVKGTDAKSKDTMSAPDYTGKAEVIASKSLKDVPFLFKPEVVVNASVPYGQLLFTEAGKYTYTVRELPGQTSRMSYDTTEYTLTIEVVLNDSTNKYEVKSCQFSAGGKMYDGQLNIVNTYRTYHPSTPSSKPTLNTGDHYAYVMGYPDGTVRPNGSITRAEVSAILFRLLSDKTRDEYFTTESSFTDVKAGAWYNNSIATLEKAGVIVDTAKGGAFRPNEAITRAELAAMLAQFSDAKPVKGVKFSDVSAEHWAYEAIAIAAKMGWIEGYPDGTFRPDATITRAEMMTLVNRALERVPSDEDHLLSKRVMLTFPDCKSSDWFYIAVQEATNSHTYERAATEKNGDEQWTALRANRDWTLLEK